MQPLRYYHYISAAKVDMLYSQLPAGSRRHSSELSGGVPGILQAKHGVTARDAEPTLYAKLAKVEEEINNNHPPGSPEWRNEPYIRGRAKLWSIVIDREPDNETDSSRQAGGTVLFAGRTKFGADLVLGGSKAHLLPGLGVTPTAGDSSFFYLQRAVSEAARKWRSLRADDVLENDALIGEEDEPYTADFFMRDSIQYIVREAVDRYTQFKPVGYCEYLARTICRIEGDEDSDPYANWSVAVLATPIYVAQLEIDDESEQQSIEFDPWE